MGPRFLHCLLLLGYEGGRKWGEICRGDQSRRQEVSVSVGKPRPSSRRVCCIQYTAQSKVQWCQFKTKLLFSLSSQNWGSVAFYGKRGKEKTTKSTRRRQQNQFHIFFTRKTKLWSLQYVYTTQLLSLVLHPIKWSVDHYILENLLLLVNERLRYCTVHTVSHSHVCWF